MTLLTIDFQMFLTWYCEDRRVACAHEAGLDRAFGKDSGRQSEGWPRPRVATACDQCV